MKSWTTFCGKQVYSVFILPSYKNYHKDMKELLMFCHFSWSTNTENAGSSLVLGCSWSVWWWLFQDMVTVFLEKGTEFYQSIWHLHVQLLVALLKAGYNQCPELCSSLTPANPDTWQEWNSCLKMWCRMCHLYSRNVQSLKLHNILYGMRT